MRPSTSVALARPLARPPRECNGGEADGIGSAGRHEHDPHRPTPSPPRRGAGDRLSDRGAAARRTSPATARRGRRRRERREVAGAAARGAQLPGAGGAFLPHRLHRGPAGGRPEPLGGGDLARAVLLRQDPGAARHATSRRRPALVGLPYLRPMATITEDSLAWYGADPCGGRVHDVIGTRCDPYTNRLLTGGDYHHCCHSNLTGRWRRRPASPLAEAERACARRAQRLHVHRLHPRGGPLLHEGEPGAARRLPRVLRRDRPPRRALGLPGRRLFGRAFERRRRLPSAPRRDLRAAGAARGLAAAGAQAATPGRA